MPSIGRPFGLDHQTWRTATWFTPFVAPALLLATIIVLWFVGKLPAFAIPERAWLLTGALCTAIASLAISCVLLASRSSQLRGVALSIAGSSVIVLAGCVAYGFLGLRW